jgi:hypothetical protein
MNKIKLKLQNKDRTTTELREDLERIASEQYVSRNTDNPSRLNFSTTFLEQYNLSPSTETSPAWDNSAENSPNSLELHNLPNLPTSRNAPLDSSESTQIEDTTPTPQDDNKDAMMEEDKDGTEDRDTTPSFTPSINNLNANFYKRLS